MWVPSECLHLGPNPLLHVGLDENKVTLLEIDMQATETIGANGGKKLVTVEVNKRIPDRVKKNCPTLWSIANTSIPFFE